MNKKTQHDNTQVNTMEQTLMNPETTQRQEYKEWLASLRANTRRVEEEESEAAAWSARRGQG